MIVGVILVEIAGIKHEAGVEAEVVIETIVNVKEAEVEIETNEIVNVKKNISPKTVIAKMKRT